MCCCSFKTRADASALKVLYVVVLLMIPGFSCRLDDESDGVEAAPSMQRPSVQRRSRKRPRVAAHGVDPDDAEHVEECEDPDCKRCLYLRNKPEWDRRCSILGTDVSYLRSEVDEAGRWRLYCWICAKAGVGRQSFRVRDVSNLERHRDSSQHKDALFELGLTPEQPDLEAPAAEQFRKVADSRKPGNALGNGVEDVGGRKKVTAMLSCLAASMERSDQEFLAGAESIVLHSDVRGLRLCVRFKATNAKLHTRSGLLMYTPMKTHSGADTTAAFLAALNKFCETPDGVDHDLLLRILNSTELLDADGASDAQLALQILHDSGLFPRVLCRLRDPTHAARRVIARPWAVITEIRDAFRFVISGKNSITNVIQNSKFLGQVFSEFVCKAQDCPIVGNRLRNLARRAHRFDSYQKPLTRFCMCISAFFDTAVWLTVNRPKNKPEYVAAVEFLEWASPENLVTLGMAADAADESLLLVRHFDSEDHDISELQSAAASYLSRIRYLFQEGNVQHTTGFTELILRWLSATHGFMVEQRPKCIGGPDVIHQGLIDSCLRPFQLFVRLAAETVKAEYPSYALISAFQVFSLTAAGAQSELDEERGVEAALTRLAQALGLDSQGLIEQFLDHQPIAMHEAQATRCTALAAWMAAVQRTSAAQASTRRRHPSDLLRAVLIRHSAWNGATTSGVEQLFSKAQQYLTPARNHLSEENEWAELKVMSDYQAQDSSSKDKILNTAREVWAERYGAPRASAQNRLDTGVPRQHKACLQEMCLP